MVTALTPAVPSGSQLCGQPAVSPQAKGPSMAHRQRHGAARRHALREPVVEDDARAGRHPHGHRRGPAHGHRLHAPRGVALPAGPRPSSPAGRSSSTAARSTTPGRRGDSWLAWASGRPRPGPEGAGDGRPSDEGRYDRALVQHLPGATDLPDAGPDDVTVEFTRFKVARIALDADSDRQFDVAPMVAAAQLLRTAEVDVVAWNDTAGSWLGPETDRRLVTETTAPTSCRPPRRRWPTSTRSPHSASGTSACSPLHRRRRPGHQRALRRRGASVVGEAISDCP
jgi:hypothetical protein